MDNWTDKWLITIDLDGTLLKDDQTLSQRNIKAIKKAIEMGHKVAIVTGRPWRNTESIYMKMGLKTIVGNYNGAHIHKPFDSGFMPIFTSINRKFLDQLLNEPPLKGCFSNFMIETIDKTYILDDKDQSMMEQFHIFKREDVEKWDMKTPLKKNPQSIIFKMIHKNNNIYEILTYLNRKFGNALSFRYWFDEKNDMVNLEINQKTISKAMVLRYIASYYNIPLSRTLAFGDGENDKEMLTLAELGVAMKNARGLVKSYANDVSDYSNNEDGVGKYLEKFFNF